MTCSSADLAKRWPDLGSCVTQEQLACVDSLATPNTAATPETVATCADALTAETCSSFLTGVMPPDACLPRHGPRKLGDACGVAAQCQTGFCAIDTATSLCGVCANVPAAGDSCAAQGCGPTLVCVATTQLCQAPGAGGAACSKDLPCLAGLACVGATMTAMGSCQAQVATAGAACDPKRMTGPDCDPAAGLTCDTQSLQCVTQPLATAGQACGLVGTTRTACSGGAYCSIPQGETKGVCVAAGQNGGACTAEADCLGAAHCVNGTCQLPGTATCP